MKRYCVIFLSLTLVCFISFSCKNKSSEKNEVEKYIEKNIQMPKDSILLLKNDSVLSIKKANLESDKIKIVSRINSQCHSCVHHLDQWKQELMKRFKDRSIQFVFYLYTDSFELFKRKFYHRISGTYPLLIDTTNAFIRDNNLPKMDQRFHTFLLNRKNEVILVGNPLLNSEIRELYLKEINKRLD
jgi:hypothetical protein